MNYVMFAELSVRALVIPSPCRTDATTFPLLSTIRIIRAKSYASLQLRLVIYETRDP